MQEKIVEITLSPAKLFDLYLKGHMIPYSLIANNLEVTTSYISQICGEKLPLTEKIRQSLNELLDLDY